MFESTAILRIIMGQRMAHPWGAPCKSKPDNNPRPIRMQALSHDPAPHPRLGTIETIVVDSRTLSCDGGLGALGHPRVFLRIGHHQTFCPYCSRLFVLNPDASAGDAH